MKRVGMTYVRAEKAQIDSWEGLGNPGWNWDGLFPYYLKSEGFDIPTAAQNVAGASYVPADHGKSGPLKVGYPFGLLNGSLTETVIDTWANLGIPHNLDVNGGSVRGFTVWPSTLDREKNVREDAARAYFYSIQDRPNLHVYLNTTANKVNWKACKGVVAEGLEVTLQNGSVASLKARREVLISAGSLRTPAILELSGIGNPGSVHQLHSLNSSDDLES
jgi:choline dehydrogenase-like flavoprotein